MDGTDSRFDTAHVVAWSSLLLGFGLIQGALYLKAYWGAFGLDPFQFGNASDLALIGLTSIGVTVALMMMSAMLGSYLSAKVQLLQTKLHLPWWALAVVPILLFILLGIFVFFGWILLLGMLLTWSLLWLVYRAPDVPEAVRTFKYLPYLAMAVAYFPMSAYYLGERQAARVKAGDRGFVVDAPATGGCQMGAWQFVGRLNDVYVLFCRQTGGVSLLAAPSDSALHLQKGPTPATNGARVKSPPH